MAPMKSSLSRSVSKLLGVFRDSDLSLRGLVQSSRHSVPPQLTLTGGTTVEYGGSRYHIFRTSTPGPMSYITIDQLSNEPTENVADFLVIGGGGGAGGGDNAYGGGGGAGGLIWRPAKPISSTGGPYSVSIGSGGAGTPVDNSNVGNGINGGDTTVGTSPSPIYFIAKGGGGGAISSGHSFGNAGNPGGSGGGGAGGAPGNKAGGSATQPTQPGDSGTYAHSGAGGTGGGGGGGGSGNGGDGPGSGGAGANGYTVPEPFLPPGIPAPMATEISPITTPSPEFRVFGGGGAGNNAASGGTGGGGDGFNSDGLSSAPAASYGVDGRGAGGGSGTSNNPRAYAGDGGDGIVIIRYDYTA